MRTWLRSCCCCCGGSGDCTTWSEDWSGTVPEIESNWSVGGVMNFAPSLATPGDPLGSVQRIDIGDVHSVTVTFGVLDLDVSSNQTFLIGTAGFAEQFGVVAVATGDGSPAFWLAGSAGPTPIPIVGSSATVTAQWSEDLMLVRFSSGAWEVDVPFSSPIEIVFFQGEGAAFVGDISTACEPLTPFDFMILESGDPMLTEQAIAMQGEF